MIVQSAEPSTRFTLRNHQIWQKFDKNEEKPCWTCLHGIQNSGFWYQFSHFQYKSIIILSFLCLSFFFWPESFNIQRDENKVSSICTVAGHIALKMEKILQWKMLVRVLIAQKLNSTFKKNYISHPSQTHSEPLLEKKRWFEANSYYATSPIRN